jgi:uncharacterized protein YfiM (DUF2279 family)
VRFALVMLLLALPAAARADDWLGRDKALHAGASGAATLLGYAFGLSYFDAPEERPARLTIAAGAGLFLGIAKELWDRAYDGEASFRDLTWDAVGIAVALTIALLAEVRF